MLTPITNVDYVDLSNYWVHEKAELSPIIESVMASGQFVGGSHVEVFETELIKKYGVRNCVALNSGTDALVCALHAAGIGRGDEVITPPNSFVASTAAIVHVGATPVFVDVLNDQSLDPEKVAASISAKTKAIMPVHLTGRMAMMDEIQSVAEKNNLIVIEDAAQSIGSKYQGRASGTIGTFGCFSAHPLKNLNACGDAGFVVTDDDNLAIKIRRMRNHGLIDRSTVETFGYVSRMDNIQAAILSYRLGGIDEVTRKRRLNASRYFAGLKDLPIFLPENHEDYFDTFHTFVIQCEQRDNLQSYLLKKGIGTAIHYPIPIHLQPAARFLGYKQGDFPVVERQAGMILSLPIHQHLRNQEIDFVIENINSFFGESG